MLSEDPDTIYIENDGKWSVFIQHDGGGCPAHPSSLVRFLTLADCMQNEPKPDEAKAEDVDWDWTSDFNDVLFYSVRLS